MKLKEPVPVQWLADFTGAKLVGNAEQQATGLNEIHKVEPGDVSFVDFEKYYDKCLHSPATVIIINKEVDCPAGKTLLVHPDPFSAYVKLVRHFKPAEVQAHRAVSETALIGEGTVIQPGAFIGERVRIGSNCFIYPNVVVYSDTVIGDNCIIHAGAVIGADAFYFKRRKDRDIQYDKLESCGRVLIGNSVEIGACCTIDKGVSGDTIVGDGTKFDNHVHVGHGVIIGKNCLFAAQTGIGGKTIIEDEVILWGQVGVNKDLTIGKGAVVMGQSGVFGSLAGGKTYFGTPPVENREKLREMAWSKRIPEMWERLQELARRSEGGGAGN